ncbi:ATP-binding cassette domain-containing protein [Solibacillus silvestris]
MDLIINEISKRFSNQKVLKNVNLKLSSNRIHLLLGENGAGKSTLTQIIDGKLKADSGFITLEHNGKSTTELDCAIQYQQFNAFPYLKIKEVIQFFKKSTNQHEFDESLYNLLDIKQFENTLMKNASGGMKKAISIFITILLNKPIVILDEPFADLDLKKKRDLSVYLKSYAARNEKVILIISHEVNEFEMLFDTVSILDEGMIKESDSFNNLIEKYNVQNKFKFEELFYGVTGKRLVLDK